MNSVPFKSLVSCIALFPLLALVACQQQPSVQKAEVIVQKRESEACKNLTNLQQSLAMLGAVTENSTVGEVKKAQENVAKSLTALKKSLAAVDQAKVKVLEAANTNLDKAIRTLPNKDTLAQAAANLKPKAAAVEAARAQLSTQIKCTP